MIMSDDGSLTNEKQMTQLICYIHRFYVECWPYTSLPHPAWMTWSNRVMLVTLDPKWSKLTRRWSPIEQLVKLKRAIKEPFNTISFLFQPKILISSYLNFYIQTKLFSHWKTCFHSRNHLKNRHHTNACSIIETRWNFWPTKSEPPKSKT